MIYDPWADLRRREHITFGITNLPAGEGWWLPQIPAIVLDKGLSRIERRCVLAHELVHADDNTTQCATDGPGTARIARRREAAADDTAARRLISIEQLIEALQWALGFDELAETLDVTPRLARARIHGLTEEEKTTIEERLSA